MDLFDLLIIALIALPALLRGLDRSAKRRRASEGSEAPVPTDEPSEEESDFHRALREIGLVLSGEEEVLRTGHPEPESPPKPESSPRPERRREVTPPSFAREEAFEARTDVRRPEAVVPFRRLKMAKIEAAEPERTPRRAPGRRNDIRRLLRDPRSVRDAVILAEILGSPRAPTIRL